MKKIGLYVFCVTFLFLVNINVKANSIGIVNINNNMVNIIEPLVNENKTNGTSVCDGLLGDPVDSNCPAYWLQEILDIMKYIAIVALLVLVVTDFLNALTQNDKDAIKKASNKALKRFIYCVLLFFVPIIVKILLTWFGWYSNCGIG